MCHTKEPGSSQRESSETGGKIISLCARRERIAVDEATDQLVAHLEAIHDRAIEIHNQIIEQAEVSVITELCRTAGIYLELVDASLRTAVLVPAALYGDSGDDIFGKKPLQERMTDAIDDEEARHILDELNSGQLIVFDFEPAADGPTSLVKPLAGPNRYEAQNIAGVVCRAGSCSTTPGVYSGWKITYRERNFIVFGHRLDRLREVAVRDLLTARQDRNEAGIWKRIERHLLRAIVGPENYHQPVSENVPLGDGIRRRATRSALLLEVRRTLWRHFCEPREGITMHAHLAALIDDAECFEALSEEIYDIIDRATLKSGGLGENSDPIELHEVLSPFHIDTDGNLTNRGKLDEHPATLLLLDTITRKACALDEATTIADALCWAKRHPGSQEARQIELAWMTYRTEQNLVATYGHTVTETGADDDSEGISFVRLSAVLPNIRTLFDPRCMECRLSDLDLPAATQSRLQRGLNERGFDLSSFTLANFDRDERELTELPGVGHQSCNDVRRALLKLGATWRWQRCGIEPLPGYPAGQDSDLDEGFADS